MNARTLKKTQHINEIKAIIFNFNHNRLYRRPSLSSMHVLFVCMIVIISNSIEATEWNTKFNFDQFQFH